MSNASFTFFASYHEALQYLPDGDYGVMVKAICEYALKGVEPSFESPMLKGYWILIRPTLERSIKRAEAGRLGGQSGVGVPRNSGNSNASKSIANQNNINTYKEKELEEEKEVGEGETEKEKANRENREKKNNNNARFVPPTVDEVEAYCTTRGNGIDAQHFVDFYATRGWKYGNTAIKDWKACVRTWEQRNGFKADKKDDKQEGGKLGVDEYLDKDGNRRYGSGKLPPVPKEAPPRPSSDSIYSAESNTWVTGV